MKAGVLSRARQMRQSFVLASLMASLVSVLIAAFKVETDLSYWIFQSGIWMIILITLVHTLKVRLLAAAGVRLILVAFPGLMLFVLLLIQHAQLRLDQMSWDPAFLWCLLVAGFFLPYRNRGIIAWAALVALLWYMYGLLNTLFSENGIDPWTMDRWIQRLSATIAVIVALKPGWFLFATAPAMAGRMVRTVLPLTLLTLIASGYANVQMTTQGLISTQTRITLFSTVSITVVFALVLMSARHIHELERRRNRTDAKMNALLRASDAKNRLLEEYTYIASHDLREPLSTIAGLIDLILEPDPNLPPIPEERKELLEAVARSTERMRSLVSGLLEYARLGFHSAPEPVDVRAKLQIILDDISLSLQHSAALICVGALPIIRGLPLELGLLFQNLISNSLKFRRAQEPPRITVESYELPDHSWHFLISDNGIGITPENQENVFQLFNRLHNPGVSGIGLGLAHCRRIVELHNGKIWIESNMDAGITMHFVLPSNQLVDVSGN